MAEGRAGVAWLAGGSKLGCVTLRVLVSLYIWAVIAAALCVGIPIWLALIVLLPRKRAYDTIRAQLRFTFRLCGITISTRGFEHLDRSQPHIFMGNHVNLLDPFFWAVAIPIPTVGVEKRQNFRIPFYGWLIGRWGNVPIDRTNLEQAKLDLARAVAMMREEGVWMVLMPEGTRTRDGRMAPFKKGGFHMAFDSGFPVIPMTTNGAHEIQERGSFWMRPGHVEIVFGKPLDPADYGRERIEDLMHDLRVAVLSTFTGEVTPEDQVLLSQAAAD